MSHRSSVRADEVLCEYVWSPQLEHGLARGTFHLDSCKLGKYDCTPAIVTCCIHAIQLGLPSPHATFLLMVCPPVCSNVPVTNLTSFKPHSSYPTKLVHNQQSTRLYSVTASLDSPVLSDDSSGPEYRPSTAGDHHQHHRPHHQPHPPGYEPIRCCSSQDYHVQP